MVAIPFNAAASTASGLSHSRQPHDQTPLLQSDQTGHVPKGRPSELHPASKLVDEEARSNASEAIKEDVNAKSVKGIAGVISVLILGVFIANADTSIVLATYGSISSEIGNLDDASWLVVTYTLAMCAVQPTYGKLSDVYGRKSTLITAYTFFAIGCALSGVGTSMWQVIVGRAVAGIGGAGMTSLVSVLIADKVPLRDVATWRGYVNVAATVGRSAGGPFGGYLADTIGWR
ncbi:hypothetical protein MMC12_003620, partial [Toensbergia leucococca]|nr:hypothetical protein [Toensbergia leucococca]